MGRVFNAIVRVLVVPGIQDTQCGFKASVWTKGGPPDPGSQGAVAASPRQARASSATVGNRSAGAAAQALAIAAY